MLIASSLSAQLAILAPADYSVYPQNEHVSIIWEQENPPVEKEFQFSISRDSGRHWSYFKSEISSQARDTLNWRLPAHLKGPGLQIQMVSSDSLMSAKSGIFTVSAPEETENHIPNGTFDLGVSHWQLESPQYPIDVTVDSGLMKIAFDCDSVDLGKKKSVTLSTQNIEVEESVLYQFDILMKSGSVSWVDLYDSYNDVWYEGTALELVSSDSLTGLSRYRGYLAAIESNSGVTLSFALSSESDIVVDEVSMSSAVDEQLTILAPVYHEVIPCYKPYEFRWAFSGDIPYVTIQACYDNYGYYFTLEEKIVNTGAYTWTSKSPSPDFYLRILGYNSQGEEVVNVTEGQAHVLEVDPVALSQTGVDSKNISLSVEDRGITLTGVTENIEVAVFDVKGRELKRTNLIDDAAISLKTLSAGCYIVQAAGSKGVLFEKRFVIR